MAGNINNLHISQRLSMTATGYMKHTSLLLRFVTERKEDKLDFEEK